MADPGARGIARLQWTAIGLLVASFVVSALSDSPAVVILNYVFLTLAGVVLGWGVLAHWRAARRRSRAAR